MEGTPGDDVINLVSESPTPSPVKIKVKVEKQLPISRSPGQAVDVLKPSKRGLSHLDSNAHTHEQTKRKKCSLAAYGNSADDAKGEDVELTHSKGVFALRDFPHARENCAVKQWSEGQHEQHCHNCKPRALLMPATVDQLWM